MGFPYRTRQTSATAGTGDITLLAVDGTLFQSFGEAFGTTGGPYRIGYVIVGPSTNKFFECGIGLFYPATGVISRTADSQVLASSNADNRVNIPVGVTYDVFALDMGGRSGLLQLNTNTTLNKGHLGGGVIWTGASGTFTLPSAQYSALGAEMFFFNAGTDALSIAAASGDTLYGENVLMPDDQAIVFGFGGTWYIILIRSGSINFYNYVSNTWTKKKNFRIYYSTATPSGAEITDGDIWVAP